MCAVILFSSVLTWKMIPFILSGEHKLMAMVSLTVFVRRPPENAARIWSKLLVCNRSLIWFVQMNISMHQKKFTKVVARSASLQA